MMSISQEGCTYVELSTSKPRKRTWEYYCLKNPTWWRRRTSMERSLTLITTIVVIVGIALAIALASVLLCKKKEQAETMPSSAEALAGSGSNVNIVTQHGPEDDLCVTAGCVHTASKVLQDMNPKVEPCDDFYEFACGNFVKNTNIPDDKTSITTFSVINDQLQEQLRTMIEEPIHAEEPKPFVLAKKLYKACMNRTEIESRGLAPMKQILKTLGGWPVLDGDKWIDGDFDWRQSVYKFRKVGYSVDYFIDFSVGIDFKNSTQRIIDLDQAQLGLRREYLIKGLEDRIVKAYYEYMVDIAVLFGANREIAQNELLESLKFEFKLANISLPIEKRRNATLLYNPISIGEMQTKYPSIPWMEYINNLLPKEAQITQNEIIINSVPGYLTELENLLAQTPKRVLANYVMWRAAGASVSYLTEELRNRQLIYGTVLNGKTEREARWKECIDITSGSLSISTGALYVRKYFDEDSKKKALEMVQDIRAEFKKILEGLDWMDDITKKAALEKAASMSTHIAYPDELLDDKKLEEFYENLDLSDNDYLESVLNLTLFGTDYSFKRLRKPVNKTDWISHGRPAILEIEPSLFLEAYLNCSLFYWGVMSKQLKEPVNKTDWRAHGAPTTVNAYYADYENSIQFPAGILQGAFFSSARPRYMNYGAIGFVIGHEITHGFDDQGRQFDKDGNLVDWWAPSTKEAFLKKAECIINQYGNYSVPEIGLNLNGINTQGENIADNGGIKEAYLAYNNWVKRNGPEPKLPGLPYTPQQMFWVSAANTWCAKYRPESLKMRVTTGYHSPGMFRVLGPMSNLEEFAKDFNCPVGSKMNPKNKCKVW